MIQWNNLIKNISFWRKCARWVIFALFVFLLVYSLMIVYFYIYLPIKKPLPSDTKKLKLEKEKYQKIIDRFNQKEKIIEQIKNKSYPDPFKGLENIE